MTESRDMGIPKSELLKRFSKFTEEHRSMNATIASIVYDDLEGLEQERLVNAINKTCNLSREHLK
jgi:hypothetical protein